jgi:hypothetical protein
MALYVVLAIGGYFLWLKDYRSQQGLLEPA